MKITAEVRDYAADMTDNEKKALNLEAEKGMLAMSEKYAELGSEFHYKKDYQLRRDSAPPPLEKGRTEVGITSGRRSRTFQ